jgi:hypothetical protein
MQPSNSLTTDVAPTVLGTPTTDGDDDVFLDALR